MIPVGALQTEYAFTLPKGYVDSEGRLHRDGVMRMATARDEIEPLRDPRISGPDDPYLTVLVLARVVSELGSLPQVSAREIENLFAADLAFLQDFYGIINFGDARDLAALQASVLPAEPAAPPRPPEPMPSPVAVDALSSAVHIDTFAPPAGEGDPVVTVGAPLNGGRRRDRIEELPARHDP